MTISLSPDATASSITYWMVGLSTSGSISFGCALVAGRKRVPSPAAGKTPLRTRGKVTSGRRVGRAVSGVQGRAGGGARTLATAPRQRSVRHAVGHDGGAGADDRRADEQHQPETAHPALIGKDDPAELECARVDEGRHPGQVDPHTGDGRGTIQARDGGDEEREQRLESERRRAADEDAHGQRERDSPGRVVELEHSAEAVEET